MQRLAFCSICVAPIGAGRRVATNRASAERPKTSAEKGLISFSGGLGPKPWKRESRSLDSGFPFLKLLLPIGQMVFVRLLRFLLFFQGELSSPLKPLTH